MSALPEALADKALGVALHTLTAAMREAGHEDAADNMARGLVPRNVPADAALAAIAMVLIASREAVQRSKTNRD